jgi:AcrR family transcriptional regulator
MPRDKLVTRRKILDAVGRILIHEQGSKVGINSIAKEAGVNKVMIYRYFGSLDKLLIAFAEDQDVWPHIELLLKKKSELSTENPLEIALAGYLTNFLNELRRDHVSKEISRWALSERNALTKFMEIEREKQGKSLINQLPFNQNENPDIDLAAIISLLHAGIMHLVLSARYADYYMGIDLKSARGWKRIKDAITTLVNAQCVQKTAQSSK